MRCRPALALVLVAAVWELYKCSGRTTAARVFGWRILPRANDTAMPHVWDMVGRLVRPREPDVGPRRSGRSCSTAAWYSFRLAVAASLLGTSSASPGDVMARFGVVRARPAAVPRGVADRAADRARPARRQLGRQAAASAAGSGRGGCRSSCSARSWPSSRSPSARCAGCESPSADVARADAQLRRLVAADAAQAALPGGRAVHGAGAAGWPPTASVIGVVVAEISTGAARRHRPADHRVLPRRRPAIRPRCTRPCSARPSLGLAMAGARRRSSSWRRCATVRRRSDERDERGASAVDGRRSVSKVFNAGHEPAGRRARRRRPHRPARRVRLA